MSCAKTLRDGAIVVTMQSKREIGSGESFVPSANILRLPVDTPSGNILSRVFGQAFSFRKTTSRRSVAKHAVIT
jgi:hypothetical protein